MLAEKNDSIFTAASVDSSYSMIEREPVEEYDDWVIVKKQKITILVPPLSPEHPQTEIPESNRTKSKSRRNIRRSSNTQNKRRWKQSKDGPKKPAMIPFNEVPVDGEHKKAAVTPSEKGIQNAGVRMKHQKSVHDLVAPIENQTLVNGSDHISGNPLLQQSPLVHFPGDGNVAVPSKTRTIRSSGTIGSAPRLPVGALNLVNQRVRALNLERKLQGFGGLRNWLASQGLDRFIRLFEREKLGVYQLVNLTMSKLKDMGADAVGPRRKLIHSLDRLCQPYYFKALQ